MVESLNAKVDMAVDGTSYMGLTDYGKIMIGDKAFEFYHHRDPRKFIQIPWEEVDYVLGIRDVQRKMDSTFCASNKERWYVYFFSKKPQGRVTCDPHLCKTRSYGSIIGFLRCFEECLQAHVQKESILICGGKFRCIRLAVAG